jgi:cob(I)alamin adenosyltransferase
MPFRDYKQKTSVVVVYTGDGKGKTTAGLGLMVRALGSGFRVAFIQFIKNWDVGEHEFIKTILPLYTNKLDFYKGGLGFFEAGELSTDDSREDHTRAVKKTFEFAYKSATSGEYQLVICDEINNAVHDGLLNIADLKRIITDKHANTSLCLTGRNFPAELIGSVDIATNMAKLKHHFDEKMLANKGIDY